MSSFLKFPDSVLRGVLLDQAFTVAEMIAQFVSDEAHGWEHIPIVHDAISEIACKIRTADWIPPDTGETV